MNSRRRDGTLVPTYDGQGRLISWLYGAAPGRAALGVLVRPWVSRAAGWCLSRNASRLLVGPFVRKNHLDLSDYPPKKYRSFNDFFSREIRPDRRPVDPDPAHLVAPCDGKLTAIPIAGDARFTVKGTRYTLESLLRDVELARRYQGGTLLLFRLTVDDYHRYAFAAAGEPESPVRIPGVYHTVNPRAAAACPIYQENTREYLLLRTDRFGTVLAMEVGALLVGRIENYPLSGRVEKGQEKGRFLFGGSTVILLLEPGAAAIDADILKNSAAGEETLVKLGEKIGIAAQPSGPSVR